MAPVRSYTNWNSRTTDEEEQIEPYRKYFFICEGANTETWYFKKLIDIRKELNIHPLIDIRLLEKTEGDRDISFPRRLIEFAENQKEKQQKEHYVIQRRSAYFGFEMLTSSDIHLRLPLKTGSTIPEA